MFNIAVNPVSAVPKNANAEKVGERTLTFEEISVIWHDKEGICPTPTLLAMKLILIFGVRPLESTVAKKAEFDFSNQVWPVPLERFKK